jgi:hypothetical protein
MVRNVNTWRPGADLAGDCREEFLLGHRLVVADVVGVPDCLVTVECQQETLDYVSDVHKRQGIAARPDDHPSARADPVGHPTEVQQIVGAEEGPGPDDDRRQSMFGNHFLDDEVSLRLGDRIRLRERLQNEVLASWFAYVHAIDRPRADVHEAADAGRESGIAGVLRARDIDGAIGLQRPPDAHQRGEVQDGVSPSHRRRQRLRLENVAAVHRGTTLFEPPGVFSGQREDPDAVSSILQRGNQVPPEQSGTARD